MDLVTLNKQKCNIYNSFFHYIFHTSVMLKFSWASFPIAEVPQCGVWPRFFSNSCSFMCAGFSSPRFSYCPLLSPKRRLYWMIIADFPYQIFFHPALVFLSEFLGGSQKLEFVLVDWMWKLLLLKLKLYPYLKQNEQISAVVIIFSR